jgi:RHS repeat-associated protein
MDTVCMEVQWPAAYLWMNGRTRQDNPAGAPSWMGSLIAGRRDATGQVYLRNRYYDPLTGRFTQEDPIGLAGGVNLYGFANGDPVTYSDPYGLSAEECCDRLGFEGDPKNVERAVRYSQNASTSERVVAGALFAGASAAVAPAAIPAIVAGGRRLFRRLTGEAVETGAENSRSFNPFRGRTNQELDDAFRAKGFDPRGPDPANGLGGYVNPRSTRSYHIDRANSYGERPHVDINRPRGYRGPLDKRKMDM